MKKQYLLASLLLVFAFGTFSSASAQNTSSATATQVQAQNRAEMEARRAEIDDRREAVRQEAETRRTETQTKRVEFQQEAALRQLNNVARVMVATINRLENIATRIDSRIAKIQARGGAVSDSEKFVARARVHLSEAGKAVTAFNGIDLSGETAQENFKQVRVLAADAKKHIREAHTNLMMAVRLLKSVGATLEADDSSSSDNSSDDDSPDDE